MPIGVFDSGLGGLTIVRALVDLLPDEHLVYFGDTARFPYGPRSPDELSRFALEDAQVLLEHDVKMIVVACNSAASVALDLLRERCNVPVVGVIEPGVRAAIQVTAGRLGVIATEATVRSRAYERAVIAARAAVELVTLPCPGFVELVESGDTDSPHTRAIVEARLTPMRAAGVDTLVLGCTHYPHLARPIADVMGRHVVLVSSAEETAFEVRDLLEHTGMTRHADDELARRTFITSGDERTFTTLGRRFLGPDLGPVLPWRWPAEPTRR